MGRKRMKPEEIESEWSRDISHIYRWLLLTAILGGFYWKFLHLKTEWVVVLTSMSLMVVIIILQRREINRLKNGNK